MTATVNYYNKFKYICFGILIHLAVINAKHFKHIFRFSKYMMSIYAYTYDIQFLNYTN